MNFSVLNRLAIIGVFGSKTSNYKTFTEIAIPLNSIIYNCLPDISEYTMQASKFYANHNQIFLHVGHQLFVKFSINVFICCT